MSDERWRVVADFSNGVRFIEACGLQREVAELAAKHVRTLYYGASEEPEVTVEEDLAYPFSGSSDFPSVAETCLSAQDLITPQEQIANAANWSRPRRSR